MAATQLTENYRGNNDQTVTTSAGEFMAVQRNAGYADNDGAWVVSQLPELYWSQAGCLRQRRAGKLLGIFATAELAAQAIDGATIQPVDDRMVH